MARKSDTLLAHCVLRAGAALVRDDLAAGREPARPPSRRETMRAMWRSTQDCSKVAPLIALWAMALLELERDELGVEEFAAWAAESNRTVYRRLAEFRRLWREYDTPNELARLVADAARRSGERPSPSIAVPIAA